MPSQRVAPSVELAADYTERGSISDSEGDPPTRELPGSWLVVPDWWAALIPGGYDYCNAKNAPRFALLVVLLTLIIVAYHSLDSTTLQAGVAWLEADLVRGGIVFVGVMAAAHVLIVPGAVFSLAAGAIFGVGIGTVLACLGTAVGQTAAFCIGRYLLRDWVAGYMAKKFPKWAAVDGAVSKDGWKLITLLRLSPIIPWNVFNYAVSVTGISVGAFTLSSALAIIPWTTTLVYFGSLARSMADIFDGRAWPGGATSYLLFIISGLMLVVLVAFATIISRQAIRAAMKEGTPAGQDIMEELDRMSQVASPSAASDLDLTEGTFRSQLWASPKAEPSSGRGDSNEWQNLTFHRPYREASRSGVSKPGYPRVSTGSAASGGLDGELESERSGLLEKGLYRGGERMPAAANRGQKGADRRNSLEREM